MIVKFSKQYERDHLPEVDHWVGVPFSPTDDRIKWLEDNAIADLQWSLICADERLQESEDARQVAEYDLRSLKRKIIFTQTSTEDLIKLAKAKLGFRFYEFLCEQYAHVRDVFSKAAESQISFRQFESYCDCVVSRSDVTSFLWDKVVDLTWQA